MPRFLTRWSARLSLAVFALLLCLAGAAQTYAATEPVLIKAYDVTTRFRVDGPRELTHVDGTVFFTVRSELWKSDGTSAGTVSVKDFRDAQCFSGDLNTANHLLFFVGATSFSGRELWRSDGTEAGTFALTNLHPGACVVRGPRNLTSVGDKLFFDGGVSDGTVAGTRTDVRPGFENLTNVNGTLFYGKLDTDVCQLWKSGGTPADTVLVKDVNPNGCRNVFDHPHGEEFPTEWANVNGTLFFKIDDGIHGIELWKSDGTAVGTTQIKDINPGLPSSGPSFLTSVRDTVYFLADDGRGGGLFRSDGTEAGTVFVESVACVFRDQAIAFNGRLFFVRCDDPINGIEIWTTDGTAAGTTLFKDINPGPRDSDVNALINIDGVLFFLADDEAHGVELWRSDGTADGTTLVKDLNSTSDSVDDSDFGSLIDVNGTLFFSAFDGIRWGLWRLGPQRSDYKTAARFCGARETFLGTAAFRRKYGTNKSRSNAHGRCVNENR